MATAPALRTHATYDEYLALERTEAQKHEYIDGAIQALAGGTFAHGLIASNLIQLLGNALAEYGPGDRVAGRRAERRGRLPRGRVRG